MSIFGRTGDPYFDHLNVGDHTNDFLIHLSQKLDEESVIFDVGANIGVTSAILGSAAPRGTVFSFEPDPATYGYLLATIQANELSNCHPQQLALGATSGTVNFLMNGESGSASHMAIDGITLGGANGKVELRTLDAVAEQRKVNRIDFIKIDVEGFELDVINGGRQTISKYQPSVFLEFNSFTLIAYGNQNPRFVLEELMRLFPYVYRFSNGAPVLISNDSAVLAFIHDNLVRHGCVDDLLCSFKSLVS